MKRGGQSSVTKQGKAATNTLRASLKAFVKGRRWWRGGQPGQSKRAEREREKVQEWLSC